jgi:hypothetical protein
MVLTMAVALPLQQLLLCLRPLLGRWSEHFFWGDALSLVVVLLGFGVYQISPEGRAKRRDASNGGGFWGWRAPPGELVTPLATDPLQGDHMIRARDPSSHPSSHPDDTDDVMRITRDSDQRFTPGSGWHAVD